MTKDNISNPSGDLTGETLAVLNAIAGRAEYLYHIVKAMDEALDLADAWVGKP